jgi:hypothetical protein
MKKALIHIGTGKTGTTAIQQSWFQSQKKGMIPDIGYPRVSCLKNSIEQHFLTLLYRDYERIPRTYKSMFKYSSGRINIIKNRIFREYLQWLDSCENIFLSSEYLSGCIHSEIASLKADLQARGYEDIRVLVFVRFPPSFYVSYLQQVARASHRLIWPDAFRYHFRRMIENWQVHFPGNVLVRAYDPDCFQQNSLITEIARIAEDFFQVRVALLEVPRENQSLSLEGLFVLKQYRQQYYFDQENVFKKDSEELRRFLARLDLKNPTRLQLRQDVFEIVIEKHREDLEWLKQAFGVTFSGMEKGLKCAKKAYAGAIGKDRPPELYEIFENFDWWRVVRNYNEILNHFFNTRGFLPYKWS